MTCLRFMVSLLSDGYECPYYMKILPSSDGPMVSPEFLRCRLPVRGRLNGVDRNPVGAILLGELGARCAERDHLGGPQGHVAIDAVVRLDRLLCAAGPYGRWHSASTSRLDPAPRGGYCGTWNRTFQGCCGNTCSAAAGPPDCRARRLRRHRRDRNGRLRRAPPGRRGRGPRDCGWRDAARPVRDISGR